MMKKMIPAGIAVLVTGGLMVGQLSAFAATSPTAPSTSSVSVVPASSSDEVNAIADGGADVGSNVQQQVGSQVNDTNSPDSLNTASEHDQTDTSQAMDQGPNVQNQSGSQLNDVNHQ